MIRKHGSNDFCISLKAVCNLSDIPSNHVCAYASNNVRPPPDNICDNLSFVNWQYELATLGMLIRKQEVISIHSKVDWFASIAFPLAAGNQIRGSSTVLRVPLVDSLFWLSRRLSVERLALNVYVRHVNGNKVWSHRCEQPRMSTDRTFSTNRKIQIFGFGPLTGFTGPYEAWTNVNQVTGLPPLSREVRLFLFLMNFLPDCDQK